MSLKFEAIYENGVLRPLQPVPLVERQRVDVVIDAQTPRLEQLFGILRWRGDADALRAIAEDDDFGIAESP